MIVPRRNKPRDIVFDTTKGIMSKPIDHPVFSSIKDMSEDWSRFIDDVLCLFRGNIQMAEWFFDKLNSLYPKVQFKWEFSKESAIFLDIEIILNRESKKLETKIYVTPSNKQLFLSYRSNHPPHVFKSLIYSEALRAVLICSRKEWAVGYLIQLREKFVSQEYAEHLIKEQFMKALEVDRKDLLFRQNRPKKKKKILCPLIITYNTSNPPFAKWINEELPILHQSSKMEQLLPYISSVTRQDKNISQMAIRSQHWKGQTRDENSNVVNVNHRPPGNFKLHNSRCMACKRMSNEKNEFHSTKTGRKYKISRHYTCQSQFIVYLVTCLFCETRPQYTGQTTKTMAKRHLGHRGEINRGEIGLGEHFHKHMVENNWDIDQVSEYLDLTIIASVEEGKPNSNKRLDQLETNFTNRLMSMSFHGGINVRPDTKRGTKK